MEVARQIRRIVATIVFVYAFFLYGPETTLAASNVQKEQKGEVDIYTYTTECSNLGNTLETLRYIITPRTLTDSGTAYLYLHGNDKPNANQLCEGEYRLCQIVGEIRNTIIIPQTKVTGNNASQTVSAAQVQCLLNEAQNVLVQNQVSAPQSFKIAAHSAGNWLVPAVYESGLSFGDTLVFDGCYGSGNLNFCTRIAKKLPSGARMHVYYQKGAEGTETGSKAAKLANPEKMDIYEVVATHKEIPYSCFSSHMSAEGNCREKVVSKNNEPVVIRSGSCAIDTGCGAGETCVSNVCQQTQSPIEPDQTLGSGGGTQQGAGQANSSNLRQYAQKLNQLKVTDLPQLVGILIRGALGIIGTIALVMIIYGGVLWMTARGNSETQTKAQNTIVWAALGIVLIFASYALVGFIFEIFK